MNANVAGFGATMSCLLLQVDQLVQIVRLEQTLETAFPFGTILLPDLQRHVAISFLDSSLLLVLFETEDHFL